MVFRVNLFYHLEHADADADDDDADAVIEVITKWPRELFTKIPAYFFAYQKAGILVRLRSGAKFFKNMTRTETSFD